MPERYVCAFRGRRDAYEVPLALAEHDRLDLFITDLFSAGLVATVARALPGRIATKLLQRQKPGIPDERVRCLVAGTLIEALLIRFGASPARTYMRFDAMYSRAAARAARRGRTNLFLYSPYAMPAFSMKLDHEPTKVLFQFHPHAHVESRILREDAQRWAGSGLVFTDRIVREKAPVSRPDYDDGWKFADHMICASSFTRRSLCEVGADASAISVIPYGIPAAVAMHGASTPSEFHVLFVGSGIQRKGLHHLLEAWKRASLPRSARLTVVSRVIEASLAQMAARTPGVSLRRGASNEELDDLYRGAALFCMPSLVEGFGQVYLEALSQGVPVLGTDNTCLPDLGGSEDGVFTVPVGDVDALAAALERLAVSVPGDTGLRAAASRCAGRFTWPRFRSKITAVLESLEGQRGASTQHV